MRSDFVKVKLSAKGEELAGAGELLVIERNEYRFRAGQVRDDITRAFDWEQVLAKQNRDGIALFEIVDGLPSAEDLDAVASEEQKT